MTALVWNLDGSRIYETGLDRGVLYPDLLPGVPWNGLVSVEESVEGGDSESLYFDGVKYLDFVASEVFQATIEAVSAPPEFAACEGVKTLSPGLFVSQQPRSKFGFSYRTRIGNDLVGLEFGYKLHLVYGATALPASKKNQTITNTSDPDVKQWSIKTVPPPATTYKPTAHIVIDSTKAEDYILLAVEDILYGTDGGDNPRLPSQAEVIALFT